MRTQRMSFLALAAQTGRASPDWRNELDSTVNDLLAVRRRLFARTDLLPELPDESGDTPVGLAISRYARAARSIEATSTRPSLAAP
jgi:hypothetical protein